MQTIRDYIQDDLNVLDSACEVSGYYNPSITEAFEDELLWELETRDVDPDKELTDGVKNVLVEIIQEMVDESRPCDIIVLPVYTESILDVWAANRIEIDSWYSDTVGDEMVGDGLSDTLTWAVQGWLESLAMAHAMNMISRLES